MRRNWSTPQNFFLAFIDEIEKQIIINCWSGPNRKQNNFNIYHVVFKKKKIKKNTCRYHYQNLDMTGPILESKGMCAIFQKKGKKRAQKSKIFENQGKNVQNLKIVWKRAGDCMLLLDAINCKNKPCMIYSSWDVEQNIPKFVILGNFLPFALLPP